MKILIFYTTITMATSPRLHMTAMDKYDLKKKPTQLQKFNFLDKKKALKHFSQATIR